MTPDGARALRRKISPYSASEDDAFLDPGAALVHPDDRQACAPGIAIYYLDDLAAVHLAEAATEDGGVLLQMARCRRCRAGDHADHAGRLAG